MAVTFLSLIFSNNKTGRFSVSKLDVLCIISKEVISILHSPIMYSGFVWVSYTSMSLWGKSQNFLLLVSERIFGPQKEEKTQEHIYTLVLRFRLNFAELNGWTAATTPMLLLLQYVTCTISSHWLKSHNATCELHIGTTSLYAKYRVKIGSVRIPRIRYLCKF
jgi:hypothetical protein